MSNSVDVVEFAPIDPEGLRRLSAVAHFFEQHRVELEDKIGMDLPVNSAAVPEVAVLERPVNMGHVMYDLRRASDTADLHILGMGEDPVDYELQDDDAFVLFVRDTNGPDWNMWYTIVLNYDGVITYAKEFYKGPMASQGMIGDGTRIRDLDPNVADAVIRNMQIGAKPVKEKDLLYSDRWIYREFGLEMWGHSFRIDQQR